MFTELKAGARNGSLDFCELVPLLSGQFRRINRLKFDAARLLRTALDAVAQLLDVEAPVGRKPGQWPLQSILGCFGRFLPREDAGDEALSLVVGAVAGNPVGERCLFRFLQFLFIERPSSPGLRGGWVIVDELAPSDTNPVTVDPLRTGRRVSKELLSNRITLLLLCFKKRSQLLECLSPRTCNGNEVRP